LWLLEQAVKHGQIIAKRLPTGCACNHDDGFPLLSALPGRKLVCVKGIDAVPLQGVGELRIKVFGQRDALGQAWRNGMPHLDVASDGRLATPRAEKSA